MEKTGSDHTLTRSGTKTIATKPFPIHCPPLTGNQGPVSGYIFADQPGKS
jgi:hypothetical protein